MYKLVHLTLVFGLWFTVKADELEETSDDGNETENYNGTALPYIVDGEVADPLDFPYQLLLKGPQFPCGAVIIGDQWILTAAHCVAGQIGQFEIETVDRKGGNFVEKFFTHPFFNNLPSYDISVGKLTKKLTFSRYAQPIQLATYEVPAGTSCTVSGYGITKDPLEDTSPIKLRKAYVFILDYRECGRKYGNDMSVICATDSSSIRRGACNGDSGGPLACKYMNDFLLSGIVSTGRTDCINLQDDPNGYANVAFLSLWIKNTMNSN